MDLSTVAKFQRAVLRYMPGVVDKGEFLVRLRDNGLSIYRPYLVCFISVKIFRFDHP